MLLVSKWIMQSRGYTPPVLDFAQSLVIEICLLSVSAQIRC